MKAFNTAGTCRPNEHYMVDITERLEIIRGMVARGDYFCINRGRQYGKTTTLEALSNYLKNDCCVFSISFEGLDDETFATASTVAVEFLNSLLMEASVNGASEEVRTLLEESIPSEGEKLSTTDFTRIIYRLCNISVKPVVILIDEVDQASNNEGFVKFLSVLRKMFLSRNKYKTFQSVILAGVYDIKNLKLKMRPEEQHQYNSPWNVCANESRATSSLDGYAECSQTSPYGNIAVPFDVDMSLSAEGIAGMLAEYKADHGFDKLTNHGLNFDEKAVAQMIRDYTSGYPYLVSRICQIIDAEQWTWDKDGVLKAVNALLDCGESFWMEAKQIIDNDLDLKDLLQSVIAGQYVCYEPYAKGMKAALEHDYIKRMKTPVEIASPLHKGYLLSFCFNKGKTPGLLPPVELNGRTLIEAIV